MLVERTTQICRLVRRHPKVVELISWYCNGFDLDKVDPGLTVEGFAVTNRLDPDTFVEDVQHEISSAQEPDQGFAQSREAEGDDEDEDGDGEKKDELSSAWDDEDRDEDEGYEDEDEEDLPDSFDDDEDLDSELTEVDPDDDELASAWLDD